MAVFDRTSAGPEQREADLPPLPGSFWQMVGPGAVLVGLSIGAGELIVWPRLTAKFGPGMTWAAMFGIFLQMWLNLEVGRYTLATGQSVYAGFARLGRGWPVVFLLLNVAGWIVPGWARTCGGALKVLLVGADGWGSPTVWTAITFGGVAAILFGPRSAYRSMEIAVEAMVVVITLGLLAIALFVADGGTWSALAAGALNFGWKHPDMPAYELFSAIVFAGAGGTANIFFCFYVRDKGWGMGAHVPAVVNPLRGAEEKKSDVAFRIRESGENQSRWRAWMRHMSLDQVLFFWFLNSFTMLLFIVGALAVLHAQGVVPEQEMLVLQEAGILASSLGSAGMYLFLVVGLATLFSTQLTLLDGVARSCADILHTGFGWARRAPTSVWYGRIAVFWMVAGVGLTYLYEWIPPIVFLLNAGFFGGIAMAVYAPLTLLINLRQLPAPFRPGPLRIAILSAIGAFYVAFGVVASAMVVRRLFF